MLEKGECIEMKIVFLNFMKTLSLMACLMSLFSTTPNVHATQKEEAVYVWNEEKSEKSDNYYEVLENSKIEKLKQLLDVDETENLYDMSRLHQLALDKNLVKEVEEVITFYEKEFIYYEMLILTGDENLARQYRDDENLYFTFERVGCC